MKRFSKILLLVLCGGLVCSSGYGMLESGGVELDMDPGKKILRRIRHPHDKTLKLLKEGKIKEFMQTIEFELKGYDEKLRDEVSEEELEFHMISFQDYFYNFFRAAIFWGLTPAVEWLCSIITNKKLYHRAKLDINALVFDIKQNKEFIFGSKKGENKEVLFGLDGVENGYTALHATALGMRKNCPEIAKILLNHGASLTIEDEEGNRPDQIKTSYKDTVKLLTELHKKLNALYKLLREKKFVEFEKSLGLWTKKYKGFSFDANTSEDGKPLLYAVIETMVSDLNNSWITKDEKKIIKDKNIAKKQELKKVSGKLYFAKDVNYKILNEIVLRLLKSTKSDVNLEYNGNSPLKLAVLSGLHEIVKIFLKKDPSEIDKKDSDGNTILHYAINMKNIPIIKELIKHGADTSIKDKHGRVAIKLTFYSEDTKTNLAIMVELLKSDKTRLDIDDDGFFGAAVLFEAIELKDPDLIRLLIDRGGDPTGGGTGGSTLLKVVATKKPYLTILPLMYKAKHHRNQGIIKDAYDYLVKTYKVQTSDAYRIRLMFHNHLKPISKISTKKGILARKIQQKRFNKKYDEELSIWDSEKDQIDKNIELLLEEENK
jgi:ankyrin repeat protein